MSSYAFWNNKGGVGKSFLCFVAASEYAHQYPETDVYVIDLCPQANVSETLLGGYKNSPQALKDLTSKTPRMTVAGYLEARLNSPFQMIPNLAPYICHPHDYNPSIPENLKLVCGDNLLEIISEAIRQTSQLSIPVTAWKQVMSWILDLTNGLRKQSGNRDTLFVIDCNPSFAIYTQLALVAAEYVVIPFTADDSSRRAIENIVTLLYGITDEKQEAYARLSFGKRATEEGVTVPKLHTFVSNRVRLYEGKISRTFKAINKIIQKTMDTLHKKYRSIFANPKEIPSQNFLEIPDCHSAGIIATTTGTPFYKLKPGFNDLIEEERIHLKRESLEEYRDALEKFVNCL